MAFSTTFRAIEAKSLPLLEREGMRVSCHITHGPCESQDFKLTHYRNPCNSGKPHLAFLRSYVFSNFKQVKTEAEAKTA